LRDSNQTNSPYYRDNNKLPLNKYCRKEEFKNVPTVVELTLYAQHTDQAKYPLPHYLTYSPLPYYQVTQTDQLPCAVTIQIAETRRTVKMGIAKQF